MSVLKFENRTPRSLEDMYEYLRDPEKTVGEGMFGIGVNPASPAQEMQFVQKVHGKENLEHPYVQVILSFDKGISMDLCQIQEVCKEAGKTLIDDERQIFGAIHSQGSGNIHCHYLINYVGMNGRVFRQGHHVSFYKHRINKVLEGYGLAPVKVMMPPPFQYYF